MVPIIRNQPLRSEAPSCGWHTIAAVPPAQYGLSSSSQNAMNRARHTEAHSRMAKRSGKPSVAGTSGRLQLNRGEAPRLDTLLQLNMRMALAHGIVRSYTLRHSGAYWQMHRATFDKLAAYWMIPLQSSNEGAMEEARRQRGKMRPVGLKPAIPCRIEFLELGAALG